MSRSELLLSKCYICKRNDVSCDLFFDGLVCGVCWICYSKAKDSSDVKRRLLKENNRVVV
jgi:hypothetical protein